MPRRRNPVPKYEHHKSTNRAYVRVPDGRDGRKCVYLGNYGTPESRDAYTRIIARLSVGAAPTPNPADPNGPPPDITINEALLKYVEYVRGRYPAKSAANHLEALRPVRAHLGALPLAEFTPRAFAAVRQRLIESGKLCRNTINARMGKVALFLRWCADPGVGLMNPTAYAVVRTIRPLLKGDKHVRHTPLVKRVPDDR